SISHRLGAAEDATRHTARIRTRLGFRLVPPYASPRPAAAAGRGRLSGSQRSSGLGRIRKLGNGFLAIRAQLRLIALEALLQLLASLTGAQVLSVGFAQPRDGLGFPSCFLSLCISTRDASSD